MTLLTTRNLTRTLVLCLALFYLTIISEFFDFNILNRLPDINVSALVVTCALVVFWIVFSIRARHRH
jgi:hypothetical protein